MEVSEGDRSGGPVVPPYRGPDRRGRTPQPCSELRASQVLRLTFMVFAGALAPALFLVARYPGLASVVSYTSMAAGLLAVVAGAAALVSWRITGRSLQGWLGTAFVTFGALTTIDSGLLNLGTDKPTAHPTDILVRAVVTGVLLWRAVTDHEVNSSFAPLVALVTGIGSGMVATGALDLLGVNGLLPHWASGRTGYVAVFTVAAAIWAIVTYLGVRATRHRNIPWWIATVTGLVGIASLVRTASPYSWTAMVVASALALLAVSLAVGAATTRLREALRHEDGRQLGLHRTVDALRSQAAAEQDQLAEWLHDLRNAVAGVRAADQYLRSGTESDLVTRQILADAVTAELGRLQELVEPARALEVAAVRLDEVLAPVVAAERALGLRVVSGVGPVAVTASSAGLRQAVQNLLGNARRYAPGCTVTLSAHRAGDRVELTVRDDGPGIPLTERRHLFERQHRGSTSVGTEGSGLGLFTARRLLSAMGGEIALAPPSGAGCRFVIGLPAPTQVEPTAPPQVGPPRLAPAEGSGGAEQAS